MSDAFGDWFDDCIKIDKFEDDVALSPDDYFYNLEFVAEAFLAGRAHQREVDAVIAWSTGMKLFRKKPDEREVGAACAEAIREQKIDD